ncbi:YcdB/YcdC domain-containing protein [Pontibacillus sp. HMF3514]|uniref:YcdB/YcdC domain-containing protein n=1 Tax=Pontibacillus sp. HMF3514 TaxID=2692425 RepID=UPI00131FD289|nr:YcdB/YcdC domain-containing protein [Pontibacillus sp. HMF3514]QHE50755.1 hypothetical protein GS400_01195 [Pontibacillus sp. HMF3514]
MKKKWMSGMLCTVMIAGSMTPVYAATDRNSSNEKVDEVALEEAKKEAKISKEEAIKLAKQAIEIPEDYEREDVRFDTRYRDTQVWQIRWNKRDDRSYHNIRVTVDAETGDVISLHQHHNEQDEERNFPPEVDYNKAVSIAQSYIMKHHSGLKGGLVLDEVTKKRSQERPFRRSYEHQVEFHQQVNGVPYKRNSIHFSINGNGKITSMRFNWEYDLNYENPSEVLSKKEAADKLYEQFTAGLQYQMNRYAYRPGVEAEPRLVYIPVSKFEEGYRGFGLLDAETGEWLNRYQEPYGESDEYKISEDPVSDEATPLKERHNELTQEEALEVVTGAFDIPENYELQDASYDENNYRGDENPTWRFYWRNDEQRPHPMEDIRVTVDAKTGELMSYRDDRDRYYGDKMPDDFEVKVTKEEAKEKAVNLVKKVASSKLDRLYVRTPRENTYREKDVPRSYTVTFVRKENGLQVQGQQISVSVLSDTGKIVNYHQRWNHDIEFPNVEDVISEEKAKEILFDNYKMDLTHHLPVPRSEEEEDIKDTNLIYQPTREITDYRVYLDAKTGEWIDEETGEIYSKEEKEAKDIADHPNKKQLQDMLDYNILELDKDGNLNPDEELTRAELVKFMMKALGYDGYYYGRNDELPFEDVTEEHADFSYIHSAVQRNILDDDENKFYPDQEADRAFMAKLLVEALGYDQLASFEGVFQPAFEDVEGEEYAGHIALVNRLGIVKGNGDEFHPDKAVTKADLAIAIMKFLEIEPKLNEH